MRRKPGVALATLLLGTFLAGAIGLNVTDSPAEVSSSKRKVRIQQAGPDSFYIDKNVKILRLKKNKKEVAQWSFDADTAGVDSVTARFPSGTPFASNVFEFSRKPASSGGTTVPADPLWVYEYEITVKLRNGTRIVVDPGIIVELW